jgi:Domain of unknown function (DUF3883)
MEWTQTSTVKSAPAFDEQDFPTCCGRSVTPKDLMSNEQEAQKRHGDVAGQAILPRQGAEPRTRGIIAFGQRIAGAVQLHRGRKRFRVEAPVRFYRAAGLDEAPLITIDELKSCGFDKNPPASGWEIRNDDPGFVALESCCMEVCGVPLSALRFPTGSESGRSGTWSITPDVAHNARVEASAVKVGLEHFHGHQSTDRQKDNCGWDYEFTVGGRVLCVEIKGAAGTDLRAELTPNEFQAMKQAMSGTFTAGDYRLAVVCQALSETPTLFLFAHDTGMDWLCELTRRRVTAYPRCHFAI